MRMEREQQMSELKVYPYVNPDAGLGGYQDEEAEKRRAANRRWHAKHREKRNKQMRDQQRARRAALRGEG